MPPEPHNVYKLGAEIDTKLVDELRRRFLAEANANPNLYYSQDIDRVAVDNWQLQRFLLVNKNNVNESLRMMLNTMKWRKEFGVLSIRDTDFPAEYYQAGVLFKYGKDRNGANVIVIRANVHKRIDDWDKVVKRFFVQMIENEDKNFNGKGTVLLFDNSGSGLSNLDMDLLQTIISIIRDYYPKLISALLAYELPWILQYVIKLVKSWLPEEQKKIIYLVNKKDIEEYIAMDQLPDFMGGTCGLSYRNVPNGLLTVAELAEKHGIKKKSVDDLMNLLKPYLEI